MDERIEAQDILLDAANAISDRSDIRDDDCGKSMIRTVAMFNNLTGEMITEKEGWFFMACVKLARSQQGQFHLDDYIDASAYIALAGEAAYGEVRPSRNGPQVCKNVQEDESDVHGPWADQSAVEVQEPLVDLSGMPGK